MVDAETNAICIAATFRADPLEVPLRLWMEKLGIPQDISFAPYGQVWQELLDHNRLLRRNHCGINVLALRLEDWDGDRHNKEVIAHTKEFLQALDAAASNCTASYLVCICPPSPVYLERVGGANLYAAAELEFVTAVHQIPGVYAVSSAALFALYPVADWYDAYSDEHAQLPFKPLFFTALATMIARRYHVLLRPPRKVIVLDCDNTLWSGICAEDALKGLVIGEPHLTLQRFVIDRAKEGLLLCLASKNNCDDVKEVFGNRSDMLLKWQDVTSHRINWQSKSDNLKSLADELRLSLEQFIFIDDDPVECEQMRTVCPEVLTLQLPRDLSRISGFLNHVWDFDVLKVTEEGRLRAAWYRQDDNRSHIREAGLTMEEFIRSLELRVHLSVPEPRHLDRIAELTQRSNQFNASTKRRNISEILGMLQSGYECLIAHASDRFGDYGLVGVILFREAGSRSLDVDTFLLSCRALGRNIEFQMLNELFQIAKRRNLPFVEISYFSTPRNTPALSFLEQASPTHRESVTGGVIFRFTTNNETASSGIEEVFDVEGI